MAMRSLHALLALSVFAACSAREGTVLRRRGQEPVGDDGGAVGMLDAASPADAAPLPGDDASAPQPGLGGCAITKDQGFVEGFTGGALDPTRWLVAHGNQALLGERALGGFSRDNVRVADNKLVLTVRGDLYTGPVRGFSADGSLRPDGVRCGAAIATRDLYMSGTYQWEGQLASEPGVRLVLAVLRVPSDTAAVAISAPGLSGSTRSYGFIEGALIASATQARRWQIALPNGLDNGQQQSLRIDWHAGGPGIARPFVDFWHEADNLLLVEDPQPARAGRMWLAAFVPGDAPASFDSAEIVIETAFITTFAEGNDACSDAELPPGVLVSP